jgi:hypothetical protein
MTTPYDADRGRFLDESFFFKLPDFIQLAEGILQTLSEGRAFHELA